MLSRQGHTGSRTWKSSVLTGRGKNADARERAARPTEHLAHPTDHVVHPTEHGVQPTDEQANVDAARDEETLRRLDEEIDSVGIRLDDPITAALLSKDKVHNEPHSPDAKRQRRKRVRSAWRATTMAIVASDVITALVTVTVGMRFSPLTSVAVTSAWLVMILVRSSLADRTAALLDRRPYLKSNAYLTLALCSVSVLAGTLHTTRVVLALGAVLTVLGLSSRTILKHLHANGWFARDGRETVLVVGTRDSVRRTIAEWREIQSTVVVGACLAQADEGCKRVDDVPVLGSVADVATVARQLNLDIVALHDVDQLGGLQLARLQYALEECGTQLSVITPATNVRVDRTSVRRLGRRVVVDISYGTPRGVTKMVKTAVDQFMSAILLVIALPILLACGLAVRLSSPGPMIFRQVRVGEGGTTFVMYKLRTMHTNAEARLGELLHLNEVDGGGQFKMAEDPRITKVGRFLRRSSLDELPQLLNVLTGQMSLIGPRPALPSEVVTYDDAARRRLAVKPGMTGLWQVSGRSNLSWDEVVRLDSDYIDNWRPGRELAIAFRTVKAVFTRSGAH